MKAATRGLDVGRHGIREGRGALPDDLGAARGNERGVVADAKPGERLGELLGGEDGHGCGGVARGGAVKSARRWFLVPVGEDERASTRRSGDELDRRAPARSGA